MVRRIGPYEESLANLIGPLRGIRRWSRGATMLADPRGVTAAGGERQLQGANRRHTRKAVIRKQLQRAPQASSS